MIISNSTGRLLDVFKFLRCPVGVLENVFEKAPTALSDVKLIECELEAGMASCVLGWDHC